MKRVEWVLGILLVVLLLIVVGISVSLWLQPGTTAVSNQQRQTNIAAGVAPTSVFPGATARVSYAAAQQGIADWHSDAILLQATATWPQGASQADIRSGVANWGYTFYSPSTNSATLVTVINNTPTRGTESPYTPPDAIVDTGAWVLDSQQAVQLFLEQGGDAFLRNNRITTLIMQLATGNPSGRMEWLVSLFANESQQAYTMRIDATSGEILEVIQ